MKGLPYRARGRGTSGGGIPVRICPGSSVARPWPTHPRPHLEPRAPTTRCPPESQPKSGPPTVSHGHTTTRSRYPRTPPLPPPAPLAQLAKSKWQMLNQLAVLHRRPPGAPRTQTNKGNDPLHFRRRPAPIQHNSYKPFLLGKPDFYSKNRRL